MKFSKYNNPSKKRNHKRMSRTDADITATKAMIIDKWNGYDLPLTYYDEMSDSLSGNESRGIRHETKGE